MYFIVLRGESVSTNKIGRSDSVALTMMMMSDGSDSCCIPPVLLPDLSDCTLFQYAAAHVGSECRDGVSGAAVWVHCSLYARIRGRLCCCKFLITVSDILALVHFLTYPGNRLFL